MRPIDAAGLFLADLSERMMPGADSTRARAVLDRACGGQLAARAKDGRPASALTVSGIPLEASVSGGSGQFTPAVRYATEAGTQELDSSVRFAEYHAAIRDLTAWLPERVDPTGAAEMLSSFVATLLPDPTKLAARHRSAACLGIVHHALDPGHLARLKVYGLFIDPGATDRVRAAWPSFAPLGGVPDNETMIRPLGAALELDARGELTHKVYLRVRHNDPAAPMKLVRHFGDAAWEVLAELDRCGVDTATLHRHTLFVCCARRGSAPASFALYVGARGQENFPDSITELATRHHGGTDAVDTLTLAAESAGAQWHWGGFGIGFAPTRGVDKFGVYGTPVWNATGVLSAAPRNDRGGVKFVHVPS
ncbi:hypothetical protein [Nocardia callitridis]|uniref:Uncharacterized protein n=1 Tax=Nocardia callitridis TaxID=648753 RepID=A0ABP9JUZ8_9NOCA